MVANSETIVNRVADHSIDIGLIESPSYLPSLQNEVCCDDELVVICAPGHALAQRKTLRAQDLASVAWVRREPGSGTREFTDNYIRECGLGPDDLDVVMELGSPEAMKGAVATGSAVAVVSRATITKELQLGTLVAIALAPRLIRTLSLVHPKEKFRSRLITTFVEFAMRRMVDTVLYFEGDTHSSFRLIRAFKNRYGAVNELGVFAMTDKGLKGVSNPSALFLSQHGTEVAGSCVMVTQEGTRPMLVEIQALVDEAHAPNPRRLSVGVEQNRLALLLAVLHRHVGVGCFDQDVFVNAVGGVRIGEPAADLPVLLAIVSSLRNRPLPPKLVAFGEVGLAGEVRAVQRGQERLREAAKLGFTQAIVPKANRPRQAIQGMDVLAIERVGEAFAHVR